jgi:hypothetical protein
MLNTLFALTAFRVRDFGEVEGDVGDVAVRAGVEEERDLPEVSCTIVRIGGERVGKGMYLVFIFIFALSTTSALLSFTFYYSFQLLAQKAFHRHFFRLNAF